MIPGLTLTYQASAAVARRRIVKFTADRQVGQASASGDDMIGISDMSADVAQGGRVDVRRSGTAELELAGPIGRGKPVTADANGRGVLCNPGAGTSASYIGFLEAVDGAAGDIADIFICPGRIRA